MKVDKEEIRLYFEDRDRDGRPEMLIARYINNVLVFSTFASASRKNGVYDAVKVKGEDDGDPDFDEPDDELYVQLANVAAKLFN